MADSFGPVIDRPIGALYTEGPDLLPRDVELHLSHIQRGGRSWFELTLHALGTVPTRASALASLTIDDTDDNRAQLGWAFSGPTPGAPDPWDVDYAEVARHLNSVCPGPGCHGCAPRVMSPISDEVARRAIPGDGDPRPDYPVATAVDHPLSGDQFEDIAPGEGPFYSVDPQRPCPCHPAAESPF